MRSTLTVSPNHLFPVTPELSTVIEPHSILVVPYRVNTQSLLRRGSSFLKSIQCRMFLVLLDVSSKENQVMT